MTMEELKMMDISSNKYALAYVYRHNPEFMHGKDMKDCVVDSMFNDKMTWKFPEGIQETIEDEKLYLVWYEWQDCADMRNSSIKNTVIYIEKAPVWLGEALTHINIINSEIKKYINSRKEQYGKR